MQWHTQDELNALSGKFTAHRLTHGGLVLAKIKHTAGRFECTVFHGCDIYRTRDTHEKLTELKKWCENNLPDPLPTSGYSFVPFVPFKEQRKKTTYKTRTNYKLTPIRVTDVGGGVRLFDSITVAATELRISMETIRKYLNTPHSHKGLYFKLT